MTFCGDKLSPTHAETRLSRRGPARPLAGQLFYRDIIFAGSNGHKDYMEGGLNVKASHLTGICGENRIFPMHATCGILPLIGNCPGKLCILYMPILQQTAVRNFFILNHVGGFCDFDKIVQNCVA